MSRLAREAPETLISTLIESRFGRRITEIRQDVRAIAMPAALAKPLAAEARSPALEVTRRYLDAAGTAVEISITVHPADRFTLSSRLTRDRGGEKTALTASI